MTGSIDMKNGHEPLKNGSSTASNKDSLKKDGIRSLKLSEHVGFDSLPEQFVSRVIREGFVFNMMVIGATGIGKTTLVDSLFNTKFIDVSTKSHNLKTVDLHVHTHELQEKHIKMRLSVAETRGFGDQINKTDCYKNVLKYIDEQCERYLQEELKIHRSNYLALEDTRIHCCLYLISPFGHGLMATDLITMKQIDQKVNLIPVIAKADTITKDELTALRKKIMSEIKENDISVYNFPLDDPEIVTINRSMNDLQPFAVVASHDLVRVGNKKVRARQYPWGTVQVENESHSDFVRLREMLLRVNLEDLRESTHTKHYEAYRRARLEQMGFGSSDDVTHSSSSFQETFEARRSAHLAELKRKEEELRSAFVVRVKEKEAELKDAERELHSKFDALKKKHQDEKKRLEEEKKSLEDEMMSFRARKESILSSNVSGSNLALTMSGKNKKK